MITTRTLAAVALGLVLSTPSVQGQGGARYRDFQLGGTLASVSDLTGVAASDIRTLHRRPALLQELQWRLPYLLRGATAPQSDPVREIVFSFYNDQLFRLVIDYDRQRTDGMTDPDLIEALSIAYGPPVKPAVRRTRPVLSQLEEESGTPVARWGDAEYSVVLYRSSDLYLSSSQLRVIMIAPRIEALARAADAQAIRLDEREAPQREIARQKKEVEDTRVAQEKARLANKAAFRP